MTRKLAIVCVALGWTWLGGISTIARAQDPILTELYGTGVHVVVASAAVTNNRSPIRRRRSKVEAKTLGPIGFRASPGCDSTPRPMPRRTLPPEGGRWKAADINHGLPGQQVARAAFKRSGRLMLERYRVQAAPRPIAGKSSHATWPVTRTQPRPSPKCCERRLRRRPLATRLPPRNRHPLPANRLEKPAAEKPPAEDADDPFADDASTDAAEMPGQGG